jgi:hypothetical protein
MQVKELLENWSANDQDLLLFRATVDVIIGQKSAYNVYR